MTAPEATPAEVGAAGNPVAAVSAPAHERRRLIFAIVAIAIFMGSVDQTIVATALPAIQHDLHARLNWSSWTITIYALGRVIALPFGGKLSDLYGRKNVFLVATAIFTFSSLCCAVAGNIYILVGLRAVQALGGGVFMPSATGIVSDHFGQHRDRAVGAFSSINPIGAIVGPIAGGAIVAYWSWRGIFLINLPAGIVLILLGLRYIPTSGRRPRRELDVRGALLLAALLLSAMSGVAYLGEAGASAASPWFLVPEAAATALSVVFVRHSARHPHALVPMQLLRGHGFGVMNFINFLYGGAAFGFGALVPLYAQQRFGIDNLQSGTLLSARAIGTISVAGLAVTVLRRTGYRWPMVGGFVIVSGGLVAMSSHPILGLAPYTWLTVSAAITGVGMGLSLPAANNASLQLAVDQVGAVAGMRGMFRQSGSIIAVSITTAIAARSSEPGLAEAHVFLIFGLIILAAVSLVRLVPEHRGGW